MSKARDGAALRKERMMMVLEFVKGNMDGRTLDQVQKEIGWKTGLSPKRISDYLKELVGLGKLSWNEETKRFRVK